jgi:hypothetical protein
MSEARSMTVSFETAAGIAGSIDEYDPKINAGWIQQLRCGRRNRHSYFARHHNVINNKDEPFSEDCKIISDRSYIIGHFL